MASVRASGMDNPTFAACFTSVAGRFGNGGQTDYAAANSVLDAEMARLTASGECRGVAIGWTGWRDVGMATRGSIEAVFQAAGIETFIFVTNKENTKPVDYFSKNTKLAVSYTHLTLPTKA